MVESIDYVPTIKRLHFQLPPKVSLRKLLEEQTSSLRLTAKNVQFVDLPQNDRLSDSDWLKALLTQWLLEGRVTLSAIEDNEKHRKDVPLRYVYKLRIEPSEDSIFIETKRMRKVVIIFHENEDSRHYEVADWLRQNSGSSRARRKDLRPRAVQAFKGLTKDEFDRAFQAAFHLEKGLGINQERTPPKLG